MAGLRTLVAGALLLLASVPIALAAPAAREDSEALILLLNRGDPTARAEGARRLGATGNAAYLRPLGWALEDEDVRVVLSAIAALGEYRTQEALTHLTDGFRRQEMNSVAPEQKRVLLEAYLVEIGSFPLDGAEVFLQQVVLNPFRSNPLRKHALSVLVARGAPGLTEFLTRLRPNVRGALAEAVDEALRARGIAGEPAPVVPQPSEPSPPPVAGPVEPPAAEEPPPAGVPPPEEKPRFDLWEAVRANPGRALIVGSASTYGLYLLDTIGRATRGGAPNALVIPSGFALGGGTAFLLTYRGPTISAGQGLWWSSTPAWGIASSNWAADFSGAGRSSNRRWFNVGGETVGLAVGTLTVTRFEWDAGDTTFVNASGLFGVNLGLGLDGMWNRDRVKQHQATAALAGAWSHLALSGILNDRVDLSGRDTPVLVASMTYGMWAGSWLPAIFREDPEGREHLGGIQTGATLGYWSGLYLSQAVRPRSISLGRALYGGILGNAFGAGAGIVLTDEFGRASVALMEGWGALGVAGGAFYEEVFPPSRSQPGFKSWLFISGMWHGAWISKLLPEGPEDRRDYGGVLAGTPTALVASTVLGNVIVVPPRGTTGLYLGEMMGTVAGAGAGYATGASTRGTILHMVGGGLSGSAFGYYASQSWSLPASVQEKWLLPLGGLIGGWYGGWFPTLIRPSLSEIEDERMAGGVMLGSMVGVTTGMWGAHRWEVQPRTPVGLFLGQSLGSVFGAGVGYAFLRPRRTVTSFMLGGGAAGLASGYAFARYMDPPPGRGEREMNLVFLSTVSGAWFGSWLPTLRERSMDDVDRASIRGGAMMGAPLGLATSLWIASNHEVAPRAVPGMFLGEAFGASIGAGAGFAFARPRRTVTSLMLGGSALGIGSGYAFARGLSPTPQLQRSSERTLVALGTLSGLWYGGWLASLAEPDAGDVEGRRIGGGMMMGGPASLASALWIANKTELDKDDVSGIFLGETFGLLGGAGVGLLTLTPDRTTTSLMLGGGAAGAAAGYYLTNRMPKPPMHSAGGRGLVTWAGLTGAWYGAWLPTLVHPTPGETPGRRVVGGAMIGSPLLTSASAWVASQYDIPPRLAGGLTIGETAGLSFGTGLGSLTLSNGRTMAALMLSGGLLGSVAGSQMALRVPPRPRDWPEYGPLIPLTTLVGAWYGAWLPRVATRSSDSVPGGRVTGGAMMGAPLGLSAGFLLAPRAEQPRRLTGFFLGHLLGSMAGAGAGMVPDLPVQATTSLMLAGGAGIGWLGAAALPGIEWSPGRQQAMALGTVYGLGYGALLPVVVEGRREQVNDQQWTGGLFLGGSAGLLATALSFSWWDPSPSDVAFTGFAGLIGSTAGLGMGLAAEEATDGQVAALVYTTGLAGLALGARAAPTTRYTGGAALFSALATAYGAGQGLALALSSESSTRQRTGGVLLGSSVGLATSLLVTHDVELGSAGAAIAYTGGLWGGWIGAWSAYLAGGRKQETTTTAVIVSNAGQILSSFGLLHAGISPRRMGWINLYGLTGMGIGSGVGSVFGKTIEGNLGGSVAGLAVGSVATAIQGAGRTALRGIAPRRPVAADDGTTRLLGFTVDAVIPNFLTEPEPMGSEEDLRMLGGVTVLYH